MTRSIRATESTPERIAAEHAVLARRVQRMTGELTTAATTQMEALLPWFSALPANERASVSIVAQSGISNFVEWFSAGLESKDHVGDIFSSAPRELARALTLQQTVELVRTSMAVVEELVEHIAGSNQYRQSYLRESLLRYSSEIAFAAAEFYARAAENRGAWDARLQDLVLDAILAGSSDDALLARAAAAGWDVNKHVVALVGPVPSTQVAVEIHMEQIRRTAKSAKLEVMVGVHNDRMITIVGGIDATDDPAVVARPFAGHFGAGTVVAGSIVSTLQEAHASAQEALSGYRALGYLAGSPRVLRAAELIAARVISGDTSAIEPLVAQLRSSLREDVRQTLACYLESAPTIEGCARALFVHVNTVRYRLKRVMEVTGLDPFEPADALTLRIALMIERNSPDL
jgi:sugar diacid utilization regulator